MVYYNEQLCQKARELALQHDSTAARSSSKRFWIAFDSDVESIRSFAIALQGSSAGCAHPAEQWLLDNAEFIEEQALVVRTHLSNSFIGSLPYLRKSGMLRIQSICEDYLEQVDGVLGEESFAVYTHAYQEISVLTLAEAWSIPYILRVALIRRLAKTMMLVRERRDVCMDVERFLSRIGSSRVDRESISAELDNLGQTYPLSGPWIVHLIRHLREWADDSETVREWLLCKFENGSDDLDRIITYEHQLQAAYQVTAGNLISSLRNNERRDWNDMFENISLVEQTLRQECTGVYPLLDVSSRNAILKRIELLARRMHVQENLIAGQSVALASQAADRAGAQGDLDPAVLSAPAKADESPRQTFAAYYLFEPAGLRELHQSLRQCSQPKRLPGTNILRRATGTYLSLLSGLFVLLLIASIVWISSGYRLTLGGLAAVLLASAILVSEWSITWLHWGIERFFRPRPLLRFDFSSGVPEEAATMVVIPAIWSTPEEVDELADRLELHYLANRDPNIHFALLGDFTDAREEKLPQDAALMAVAKERIASLNRLYGQPEGPTFHLYQRRRQWNDSEGVFMGWERKRGKLVEFVELLQGSKDTSYDIQLGEPDVLPRIRYVITLDADTQLPLATAQRMIGTLHLPYNRPRLNQAKTRVIEGYGVLQPRIGISYDSAMRSRLALLGSEPGMDPYVFAASDPYQDALGQGIFTGKGIFDVGVFAEVICDRIPDNQVLSHDLLEGGFLRAALLSDIELIDDQPAKFIAYQKRMSRWVRGDWQLVCWLYPRVCDRRGVARPVDLPAIARWQIIDNLRRSLLPFAYFVLLGLGLTVLPGSPLRWFALILATLLLPVLRQLVLAPNVMWHSRRLLITAANAGIVFWTLPFQSAVLLHAIGTTLYRLFISKKRMLEWTSSSHIERSHRGKRHPALLGTGGGYFLVIIFAIVVGLHPEPLIRGLGLATSLIWAAAPLGIRWLDRPLPKRSISFTVEEEKELLGLAKDIWAFYKDYAGPEDHYLPPDNVQIDPPNGVAHRTSPTNIGFLLTSLLTARDLNFIDTPELVDRLERTVATVERLEKWNGHLYNWYDTTSLATLSPRYVSTVDSGNFVASLIAVKQGLAKWVAADLMNTKYAGTGNTEGRFTVPLFAEMAVELEDTGQGEEALYENEALIGGVSSDKNEGEALSQSVPMSWLQRSKSLLARIEALIAGTDFRPLYDQKAKLFVLGYHSATNERDNILYDLLASEARQTSFVAIALGQISVSHWLALGRTMKKQGPYHTLISWSGTMFEYLMPCLLMRTYRRSIWDSTYRGAVKRQIEYAHGLGVPFGISESGYYAFDYQMNFQYRAFGVPDLGFKRGLEQDLVLAPYATVMALPFAFQEGMEDLRQMEKLGARGKYGFYEAIDYTAERMPEGRTHRVIRSFMAHHQGMSLLTISNLLLRNHMVEYFHSDKRVQAAELLLQERIPARANLLKRQVSGQSRMQKQNPAAAAPLREYQSADTPVPEVNVHSNGSFTTVVTNSGSGFIRYEGLAISRWREDPVADNWGSYMYIRDVARDKVWSPAFQPCQVSHPNERVQFANERSAFIREDEDMLSTLEISVSPELNADVRRLTLSNKGSEERILEVTTFLELVLAPPDADAAHPAFSKLFVETEYEAETECLLARKRPRDEGERRLWAVHALMLDGRALGPVEFETERACFIGRGHTLADPKGVGARLGGTVGAVVDPAFIMRRRFLIPPGQQAHLFAVTGAAETREQAVEMIRQLSQAQHIERAFQLAWTRCQIEQQHLNLTSADAAVFGRLAARVLYTSPLKQERENSIAANVQGQQSLWAHGVSGDRPVILVRIEDTANLPFIHKLLLGHEYLRRKGLLMDVVILNESAEGYQQDLQEALRRAVEQSFGQGGIYILQAGQLSDMDKCLFFAVAKLVLRADGPSLRTQLHIPAALESAEPMLVPKAPPDRFGQVTDYVPPEMSFFNGWGGFSPDGREYHILLRNGSYLPAPWINVMANPKFGCLTSELFTGYTWWRNSRECKLTPWSNDPALDPPGEMCYIRDEESGEYWTIAPARAQVLSPYQVTYGRGYSRYRQDRHGLLQDMTVFVPLDDPVKVVKLKMRNATNEQRKVSVTYYAEWVLGVRREGNASCIVTDWDTDSDVLLARNTYQEHFREATAFLAAYTHTDGKMVPDTNQAYMNAEVPGPECSWTGDRLEFLGRNRSFEHPEAMGRVRLSGKTGPLHDACGAIQTKLVLEPGEERTVCMLLGCEDSRDAAVKLAAKYRQEEACEQAYAEVQNFWDDILGRISISTPSKEMDILLNNWLLYQTLSCRMWARSAFYQAGGAYGFRDQLQDSLALLHSRPDLTRAQIILHASHQYEEGDVQHWWHEETNRGIRTLFSDDLLWLPYAVIRYLEHTEDESVLGEMAPFLHSEPLREGEHERYEVTVLSGQQGTVFEHCLRAIERGLRLGEHGLPLMGIGDWNDGMSRVGAEGRGESVWLGWFLGDILNRFAEICERRGDRERAGRYRDAYRKLSVSLNEHGWDGQWFRRAFTDGGQWLGSIHNAECRIDAIAQSWSVISGLASPDKAVQAMRSFDRELVDRSLSIANILTPPFDRTEPSPGYIQGYPPGIRENGGQYTHGVIWSIVAWCVLGDGNKAFELFHMLNPLTHTMTSAEVRQYVGEPYVMAADVYSTPPHKGHAGWTWYTGASGWMYQAGIEWIIGLRRQGDRLYINPCIPQEWPGFTASYRFGSAEYKIAVQNPSHHFRGFSKLSVDGKEVDKAMFSVEKGPFVQLQDDGQIHEIVLTL